MLDVLAPALEISSDECRDEIVEPEIRPQIESGNDGNDTRPDDDGRQQLEPDLAADFLVSDR